MQIVEKINRDADFEYSDPTGGYPGSEATGWHHYDGAREFTRERPLGTTAEGRIAMRSAFGIERRISS